MTAALGAARRDSAVRRERPAAVRIPYTAHIAPNIVRNESGDYVQVFKFSGASFESADDEVLNNWHERLNVLWRNIASPNVALWTHIVRRREYLSPLSTRSGGEGQGEGGERGFAARLDEKYRAKLSTETLMVNDLYLSVVYRPVAGAAPGILAKLLSARSSNATVVSTADARDACEKLAQTLSNSLARYEPEPLGTYRLSERLYSSALEFFGVLINGEWQRVPLSAAPLNRVLATTRPIIGTEVIEYRLPTRTRYGAVLGIKEYATPSTVGMFDRLLSAPFEFVLTQSFAFLTKGASQGLLQRQYNQMLNAGDFAVSQAEELKDALDALTANEFVMGDHHFTLQVLSDDPTLKRLNDDVALARSMLADTGITTAREDLALEAAFWAQLPGCFSLRPRKAPITSRNFCAKACFHNFPSGRATGNHWGEALALLITSARSPYYFSLHASDPKDPDGGSRKDTGHTFICGPTGSGKSVFIGFMLSMLSRQGASQVVFDKDRGLEILMRALGGTYLPIRNGMPTGFNPLQLPPTPANVEFLKVWVRALVRGSQPLSIREENDLDHALMGVLALDAPARRLSRLIEFTDATRAEGIHVRLARWCESTGGPYAWVFDNPADSFVAQLTGCLLFGIDVTEFLDNAFVRSPVTLYLFHVVRTLLDGRRFVCWMDEFWRLLADPAFETFAKDGPKTWRKLNAVMALATQSASDVLDSSISRTIIEQTPTKILFPNPDANATEYMDGFGLSEREFKLIKEQLEPGSRMFLIKQGHYSIVCELDLKGFDAELKVISGRASAIEELHRIMNEVGPEPDDWLPVFLGERKGEQLC